MSKWPTLIRASFGNIFPSGRWDYESLKLIADVLNGNVKGWTKVIAWANSQPWNASSAS